MQPPATATTPSPADPCLVPTCCSSIRQPRQQWQLTMQPGTAAATHTPQQQRQAGKDGRAEARMPLALQQQRVMVSGMRSLSHNRHLPAAAAPLLLLGQQHLQMPVPLLPAVDLTAPLQQQQQQQPVATLSLYVSSRTAEPWAGPQRTRQESIPRPLTSLAVKGQASAPLLSPPCSRLGPAVTQSLHGIMSSWGCVRQGMLSCRKRFGSGVSTGHRHGGSRQQRQRSARVCCSSWQALEGASSQGGSQVGGLWGMEVGRQGTVFDFDNWEFQRGCCCLCVCVWGGGRWELAWQRVWTGLRGGGLRPLARTSGSSWQTGVPPFQPGGRSGLSGACGCGRCGKQWPRHGTDQRC